MAKNGTCELCGLPDDSYTIEDGGKVFKVCKLCHDGYNEKFGTDNSEDPIDKLVEEMGIEPSHGSKVETLNDEQMKKLLKPSSDERRKLYASLRKAQKGKASSIVADTEELRRELEEANEEIEKEKQKLEQRRRDRIIDESATVDMPQSEPEPDTEKRRKEDVEAEQLRLAMIENVKSASASLADVVNSDEVDEDTQAAMSKLISGSRKHKSEKTVSADTDKAAKPEAPDNVEAAESASKSEMQEEEQSGDEKIDGQISFDLPEFVNAERAKQEQAKREEELRAEKKRAAMLEKMHRAANPTIDDERIKITSPEVELEKDTRPKTNFDVAAKEHIGSVRFIEAFKYVLHPVSYAVFAGLVVLAVMTVMFIIKTWQEGLITLAAGAGAVAVSSMLVWYLKFRLQVDRRTYLLRIRQEQILFESMSSPCYRELKTKYPIIKALAWLLSKLSVILPVLVILGGTVAAVVLVFLKFWWLLAPVLAGAVVAAVLLYYIFKFCSEGIYYVLDIERNQQIAQQSMLDMLYKDKK